MKRPYASYLERLQSETEPVEFNLAGSTPPLDPRWARRPFTLEQTESWKLPATETLKALLMERLGEGDLTLVPGASQAMMQALAAVTARGDTVVIETPVYQPFVAAAEFLGLRVRFFARTGDFERDLANASKAARGARALVVSNPHCPTGLLYSAAELGRLARLGPRLIVDEVFLPLFDEGRATRLLRLPRGAVALSGLSKSLGLSALRLGWVRADRRTIADVKRVGLNFHIEMPSAPLQIAVEAVRAWDEITGPLRALADQNRAVVRGFAERHPDAVPFGFERGFFFALKTPRRDDKAFTRAMLEHGFRLRPGSQFAMPGHVRLNVLITPMAFARVMQTIEAAYE